MSYPLALVVNQPPQRSRLTTFFRLLLAIPWAIAYIVLGIVLEIVVIIAWFALLFTARWPQGLYDFSVGVLRFYARYLGYAYLVSDDFPPFALADDDYAVRLVADPPLDHYSRLKVFFRIIYIIPAAIIVYVLQIAMYLIAIASWVVIVITGSQPDGLQNALRFCLSYIIRASGLVWLVTETYPPFEDSAGPPTGVTGPVTPAGPSGPAGSDPLSSWRSEG